MKKFKDPHEVETIPGTEGWERMYPYQYRFTPESEDPERHKYEKSRLWYWDGLHYPEPMFPFDILWDEFWFLGLSQYNERIWKIPPARGIDHRILNGYLYITPIGVEDPKEIEERIPIFMKRAGYYYENWEKLYEKWKKKAEETVKELEAIEFKDLPETEDDSVVFEAKGLSSGYELLKKYDELILLGVKIWQYHFEFLNLGYAAYVTFIDTAQKIFPDISLQTLTKMVSGIDVIMYKPDRELARLAKLAVELGIDDVIMKYHDKDQLFQELEKSNEGKKWLDEFEKARYPWFYISTGTGWYHHHKSWNDDLNIPLASIRMYIEKLKKGEDIEKPTEKLQEERDKLAKEYMALIKDEDERKAFEQNLMLSRRVFPYVEEHLFYVEHWFHSVFWNKVRDLSKIFVNWGFWEDVEDIWYLNRHEIKRALWDLVTAWATGIKPRGPSYWPKEIKWRKEVYQKFKEWQPYPALGVPPEKVTEPFTIVLWGITTERMEEWLKGEAVDLDKVTEIKGVPASPGVVEGKARVILDVNELDQLQDGEILVCSTTSPSWAPAFSKIKAAVADVGGVMCHAAIVCREYGLPAVVGTGIATKAIKTGDKIRVNGDTGLVEILERA